VDTKSGIGSNVLQSGNIPASSDASGGALKMASEAAAAIIGLYQRKASHWIESRGRSKLMEKPLMEQSWLDRFRALLPPAAPVLDIGCGSAQPMAAYLIAAGHAVTGVDSSPAMIDACHRHFPAQQWIVADMRTLALQQTFSGLLAWDSFFHLCPDDQRRMFPVFRAHAAPGAALMFTSGPAYGEAIGELGGEPLYHASLDPAEYRSLLDRQGFRVMAHLVEDPDCGGHTVWLAQLI
jgi:SAM-dependent methyltransferase